MANSTRSRLVLYDKSGNKHKAILTQHFWDATSQDSKAREVIPTTAECCLDSGSVLRFIDDNTFETALGELLYRKPPSK
jgi:hypothetical protein